MEDRQELHRLVRKVCFPALENGQSYGIGNKEVGDGQIAYEISKVLDNYVSVKRNGGFWGNGTNFYEPLEYSGIPLPSVKGFKKYVDFKIDGEYYAELATLVDEKSFPEAWKVVDRWMAKYPNKELKEITGYEKAEIVRAEEFPMGKDFSPSEVWYYRLHKPRRGLYT